MGVRITFLGTASGTPTRTRNVTAQALTLDNGMVWLLDCGEATQHQCLRAGVRASRIERILLTHLHGDHSYGLPGMLSCMAIQECAGPVEVVGPRGTAEYLRTVLRLSDAQLPFRIDITELEPGGAVDLPPRSGWSVRAVPIIHRLPCFGYVCREQPRPGRFHPEAARAAGVAEGPLWGALQQGLAVDLPDGRRVEPAGICDPPRAGRTVALLGDTSDASAIVAEAPGCDVLVCETTYDAGRGDKALQWGHCTTAMTGRFAAAVGARTLIITHFSARYTDDSAGRLGVADLVRETAAECPGTTVLAAEDLWSFVVPTP